MTEPAHVYTYVHPLPPHRVDDGWWLYNDTGIAGLGERVGPFANQRQARAKRKELLAIHPEAKKCKKPA